MSRVLSAEHRRLGVFGGAQSPNLPTVYTTPSPWSFTSSIFIMSFGFSPGDVIFVSTATVRFWRIIRDARAEQTNLAGKLDFLRRLVQRIDECVAVLSPTLASPIAESVKGQLSGCLELLNSLDETVMKYMIVSPSSSGPGSKRLNLLRRGRWGIDKRDEFVESLVELRNLTELLMTYVMFEQLKSKILPATLNDSFSSNAFRLIDPLDQTVVCDIQLCDTWEVCCILSPFVYITTTLISCTTKGFEEYLKYRFRHSVGKSWVAARRFQVTNETGGGILTANKWKDTIKAGMIVSMAMVLRKKLDCSGMTEHNCPSCQSPSTGLKGKDLKRVKWLVYISSLVIFYIVTDSGLKQALQHDFSGVLRTTSNRIRTRYFQTENRR